MVLTSGDNDAFERRLREAKNEVARQKDDELAKMHIQIRKEMDDKLRLERNSLKSALDAAHQEDKAKAIEAARREWVTQSGNRLAAASSASDTTLKSDIAKLRQQIAENEQKMVNAVNEARREGEQKASKFRIIFFLSSANVFFK